MITYDEEYCPKNFSNMMQLMQNLNKRKDNESREIKRA